MPRSTRSVHHPLRVIDLRSDPHNANRGTDRGRAALERSLRTDCSPSPCQASDGRFFRWRAQGTLTIQETAGIGGTVNSITVTAFNPQSVYASDFIVRAAGTNRVAAHGALAIPLAFFYGLVDNPSASRSVSLPYVVAFTDDRGNQLTAVATWTVN